MTLSPSIFESCRPSPDSLAVQVNYHTYRKVKAVDSGGSFGGYTRVLHCAHADDVMHLVPTLVVTPLPRGLDRGYGPMHRPWALSQWLVRMAIPEDFILMTEPDHIFVAAPPLAATAATPAAASFWYVDCSIKMNKAHCDKREFNERGVAARAVPTVSTGLLLQLAPRVLFVMVVQAAGSAQSEGVTTSPWGASIAFACLQRACLAVV
jgi:hypothetical protein